MACLATRQKHLASTCLQDIIRTANQYGADRAVLYFQEKQIQIMYTVDGSVHHTQSCMRASHWEEVAERLNRKDSRGQIVVSHRGRKVRIAVEHQVEEVPQRFILTGLIVVEPPLSVNPSGKK